MKIIGFLLILLLFSCSRNSQNIASTEKTIPTLYKSATYPLQINFPPGTKVIAYNRRYAKGDILGSEPLRYTSDSVNLEADLAADFPNECSNGCATFNLNFYPEEEDFKSYLNEVVQSDNLENLGNELKMFGNMPILPQRNRKRDSYFLLIPGVFAELTIEFHRDDQCYSGDSYGAPKNSDSLLRWILGLKTRNMIHGNTTT